MNNDERFARTVAELVEQGRVSAGDRSMLDRMSAERREYAAELAFLDGVAAMAHGPVSQDDANLAAIVDAAVASVDEPDAESDTGQVSVSAATATSRRLLKWGAVAAGVIVAVVTAFILAQRPHQQPVLSAELSLAVGEVSVDGRPFSPSHSSVRDGATVAVRDGTASVALDPAINAALEPWTTARFSMDSADELAVHVERGRVVAALDPLPEGHRFSLVAGDISITAIGTVFTLDRDPDTDVVTTDVLHGTVQLRTGSKSQTLEAHQRGTVRGSTIDVGRTPQSDEDSAWALVARTRQLGDAATAQLEITSVPGGASVELDGKLLGPTPAWATLEAREHAITVSLPGFDGVRERIDVASGDVLRRRYELVERTEAVPDVVDEKTETDAEESPAPKRRPRLSPTDAMARARELLAAGKPQEAARVYRELRRDHPRSREAHAATASLGDLYLTRLGQPRAAARSFRRYLGNGGGTLAQEARLGLIRAERALNDPRAEASAIQDFLSHHPRSSRSKKLRARLTELDE